MSLLLSILLLAACPTEDVATTDDGNGGATAATSTASSASSGGATAASCSEYCALMEQRCERETLLPLAWCETVCSEDLGVIPAGEPGDTDVNSLACRIHYAELVASGDAEANCARASLSGGDRCGSYCDNYCDLVMPVCGTFGARDDCLDACAGFGTEVLDGIAQTEQLFGYGDTVQCRLHHAQAAALEHPDLHCDHTSPQSTEDTCSDAAGPNLANYCAFALEFCTGENAVVSASDIAGCQQEMQAASPPFATGDLDSFTESSGRTLGCLNYWIVQTPYDPATNCAKAHPVTGACSGD